MSIAKEPIKKFKLTADVTLDLTKIPEGKVALENPEIFKEIIEEKFEQSLSAFAENSSVVDIKLGVSEVEL